MGDREQGNDVATMYARLGLNDAGYKEFPQSPSVKPALPGPGPEVVPFDGRRRNSAVTLAATTNTVGSVGGLVSRPSGRWSGLDNVFLEAAARPVDVDAAGMKVAFFSLCGGVGRTTLAASLARRLGTRSRHVVLVNCGHCFAFEHIISANAPRVGALSFLHAPAGGSGAAVTVIEASPAEVVRGAEHSQAALLLGQAAGEANVVLYDMAVTVDADSRSVLLGMDHVLVPIAADLQSVASVGHIESLLRPEKGCGPEVHYLLNRYDDSRSFHREMRARLERMLGGRLLPVAVREEAMVQEATSEVLTVVDYAPEVGVNQDLEQLADWVERAASAANKNEKKVRAGAIA